MRDEFRDPAGSPGQPAEPRPRPSQPQPSPGAAAKAEWLVSVVLPIEAATAAEAVAEFWAYVGQLGPGELPAFVWPLDDELAMQAYLVGEPVDLDPED